MNRLEAIINNILKTIDKAHGKAFVIIFINNRPFILSLLGSRAKTKDGMPMVSTLVNVICIGINGYGMFINKKTMARRVAYIVLTKNKDDDL